jgi:hypothetical protein
VSEMLSLKGGQTPELPHRRLAGRV